MTLIFMIFSYGVYAVNALDLWFSYVENIVDEPGESGSSYLPNMSETVGKVGFARHSGSHHTNVTPGRFAGSVDRIRRFGWSGGLAWLHFVF